MTLYNDIKESHSSIPLACLAVLIVFCLIAIPIMCNLTVDEETLEKNIAKQAAATLAETINETVNTSVSAAITAKLDAQTMSVGVRIGEIQEYIYGIINSIGTLNQETKKLDDRITALELKVAELKGTEEDTGEEST